MGLLLPLIIGFLLVFFIGVPVLVLIDAGSRKKSQAKAEADAPRILADTFNGDPVVTYKVTGAGLPYETLVENAGAHGYKYLTESKQGGVTVLVFERA